MAEVLSPSMQPTTTITMLDSRPPSAHTFSTSGQVSPRTSSAPRRMYSGSNNSYRTTAAVQPYAFQATPQLRQETRLSSAPASHAGLAVHRQNNSQSTSESASSSDGSSAKDDLVIGSRPGSMITLSSPIPDLSLIDYQAPLKASPDRYRRPNNQTRRTNSGVGTANGSAAPSGTGMAAVAHLYQQPSPQPERQVSVDDTALPKTGSTDAAKRYRRRSANMLDTNASPGQYDDHASAGAPRPVSAFRSSALSTPTSLNPPTLHARSGSRDGDVTSRSVATPPFTQADSGRSSVRLVDNSNGSVLAPKSVNVPPRGSSDANKRLVTPSPLSKQTNEIGSQNAPPAKPRTYASVAQAAVAAPSPAAQHLAAVNDKNGNKGMTSRLRRAFSFGSAQELRRASAENNISAAAQARTQQQQKVDDGMDAEQQEIARRQEAAGIGAGIYSGQGGFNGSTDNISIQSTASSASMMLRKMGKGAKKSARSIKGLFRPKSVIGVPAADGPVQVQTAPVLQPSVAQVSMVTVEAERQKVNVNEHPSEKAGGVTGFPKLERNSIDAANASMRGSADESDSHSRRSVVGSDKDRADVLAAVKKGILKRSGASSPSGSPVLRPTENIPHIIESPASSPGPATPTGAASVRTGSITNNPDYFTRSLTYSRSMPNTPNGSAKSISFSPRIQFHDAWSSTEYDRRGDVATCNRLTPILAQQIKEELNTFKMEMEVHEASKPHTHFF
ncbi:hypothetical protein B0A48_09974 [Cryoendolithus antarcticus]|uniref:Protein BNI4 n=1 Tax=Cryoendolithus antarcticus TaxID=1507870 RepID=A0A1V8T3T1_9PEZI|nr:hypothetical protein B0A48_09974 [Cryoendolithus antarcticus]